MEYKIMNLSLALTTIAQQNKSASFVVYSYQEVCTGGIEHPRRYIKISFNDTEISEELDDYIIDTPETYEVSSVLSEILKEMLELLDYRNISISIDYDEDISDYSVSVSIVSTGTVIIKFNLKVNDRNNEEPFRLYNFYTRDLNGVLKRLSKFEVMEYLKYIPSQSFVIHSMSRANQIARLRVIDKRGGLNRDGSAVPEEEIKKLKYDTDFSMTILKSVSIKYLGNLIKNSYSKELEPRSGSNDLDKLLKSDNFE